MQPLKYHRYKPLLLPLLLSGACTMTACSVPDASETQTSNTSNAAAPSALTEELLYGFEDNTLPAWIIKRNSQAKLLSNTGVSEGKQALKINFDSSAENPALDFIPETPWNWTALGDVNVAFDATNTGTESLQIYLRVHNGWRTQLRSISIPAGSSATYYADLSGKQLETDSGLRAAPPAWKSDEQRMFYINGERLLDLNGISKLSLYISTNLTDKEVVIDNLRVRQNPEIDPDYLVGLVDKFGQNAKIDFKHKVRSEEHLQQLLKEELADLNAKPVMPDRSRFGGWKDGPKLEATGFFRTQKVDGKWALVDPDGYLFFSSGIANVRIANSTTFTGIDFKDDSVRYKDPEDVTPEDSHGIRPVSKAAQKTRYVASEMRNNIFTWLPSYDDKLANHYSYRRSSHKGPMPHGETYSFYQANLERRYGETEPDSYLRAWEDMTIKRMKSWGMTSFGNWVDPNFYQRNDYPYFANGWIIGDFKTVTGEGDVWKPMPDPFDPEFARRAQVTTDTIAEEVKNNPWCIGVFIDNEKSWGGRSNPQSRYRIPIQALKRSATDSPAKAAFVDMLRTRYQSVEKFNRAWDVALPSWQALNKPLVVKELNETIIADMSFLLEAYSSKYFQVVHDALERSLPNHMYMGVRMATWGLTPEGLRASKKYVDVMSYNYYREGMHPKLWDFLPEIDMPSIIGEYHFGATEGSGLFHPGLIHAADQQDRARRYTDYMNSVIDNPYMVGAHWFQYTDSPVTGRAYDGENYNVGFLTNVDTPYPTMVEAARDLNGKMYKRRFNSLKK